MSDWRVWENRCGIEILVLGCYFLDQVKAKFKCIFTNHAKYPHNQNDLTDYKEKTDIKIYDKDTFEFDELEKMYSGEV